MGRREFPPARKIAAELVRARKLELAREEYDAAVKRLDDAMAAVDGGMDRTNPHAGGKSHPL